MVVWLLHPLYLGVENILAYLRGENKQMEGRLSLKFLKQAERLRLLI